jgi:hypothetical protein
MHSTINKTLLRSSESTSLLTVLAFVSLLIVPGCYLQALNSNTNAISVGFVYCEASELVKAQQVVAQLNSDLNNPINSKVNRLRIELKSLRLSRNENTISMSLLVCDNLMSNESIYAVIVGRTDCLRKGDDDSTESEYIQTLPAISFTCAYYQIPVIDLYSRESDYSDKVKSLFTCLTI